MLNEGSFMQLAGQGLFYSEDGKTYKRVQITEVDPSQLGNGLTIEKIKKAYGLSDLNNAV